MYGFDWRHRGLGLGHGDRAGRGRSRVPRRRRAQRAARARASVTAEPRVHPRGGRRRRSADGAHRVAARRLPRDDRDRVADRRRRRSPRIRSRGSSGTSSRSRSTRSRSRRRRSSAGTSARPIPTRPGASSRRMLEWGVDQRRAARRLFAVAVPAARSRALFTDDPAVRDQLLGVLWAVALDAADRRGRVRPRRHPHRRRRVARISRCAMAGRVRRVLPGRARSCS